MADEESKPTKLADDRMRSEFEQRYGKCPEVMIGRYHWERQLEIFEAGWLARGKQEEWVSVEERLPMIDVRVIAAIKGFTCEAVRNEHGWRISEQRGDMVDHCYFNSEVHHWQPLPAAPTETGRDVLDPRPKPGRE